MVDVHDEDDADRPRRFARSLLYAILMIVLPIPIALLAAVLYGSGDWHSGIAFVGMSVAVVAVVCLVLSVGYAAAELRNRRDGQSLTQTYVALAILAISVRMDVGLLFG